MKSGMQWQISQVAPDPLRELYPFDEEFGTFPTFGFGWATERTRGRRTRPRSAPNAQVCLGSRATEVGGTPRDAPQRHPAPRPRPVQKRLGQPTTTGRVAISDDAFDRVVSSRPGRMPEDA